VDRRGWFRKINDIIVGFGFDSFLYTNDFLELVVMMIVQNQSSRIRRIVLRPWSLLVFTNHPLFNLTSSAQTLFCGPSLEQRIFLSGHGGYVKLQWW
jgi:hypothetical protein